MVLASKAGRSVAVFVSPHGFGHATRAIAVMAAWRARRPDVHFELFTTVPAWLFADTLGDAFTYHLCACDVGLAQQSPTQEDVPATAVRLAALVPFAPALVAGLAEQVRAADCRLVLCDIAPLGIAVARAAGQPSLLVEHFTWDWIYAGYGAAGAALQVYADYFASLFAQADYHAQTEPVCRYCVGCPVMPPVSRPFRQSRAAVRQALEVDDATPVVMLTMGGFAADYPLARLREYPGCRFLICGGVETRQQAGNLWHFPARGDFYHPDLLRASDLVLCKTGYSTFAELYYAGTPFLYLCRPTFRESPPFEAFAQAHMAGQPLADEDFHRGAWLDALPDLVRQARRPASGPNGADLVAAYADECWGHAPPPTVTVQKCSSQA